MYVALFDIDSTLLRTSGAGRAAFAETFRAEFGIVGGRIPSARHQDSRRLPAAPVLRESTLCAGMTSPSVPAHQPSSRQWYASPASAVSMCRRAMAPAGNARLTSA